MSNAAENLAKQYGLTYGAGRMNLRGISAEEATTLPDGGGNSANWIAGHIVRMRGSVHDLLGIPQIDGTAALERYERGSTAPGPDDATPIRDLMQMWKSSQKAVTEALTDVAPELLGRGLPEPHPLLGETVGSGLAFLAFHEAYHVGQLGLTRRRLGKDGAIT